MLKLLVKVQKLEMTESVTLWPWIFAFFFSFFRGFCKEKNTLQLFEMPSIDLGTTFTPTDWTCGEFQGSTDLYDGCHTVKPLCNHYSEEGFGVHCSTLDHWHDLIICLYFNSHYLCDRTLLHPFLKQNEPGWSRQWLLKCMDLDSCLSSFQPQTQTVFCSTYLEVTVNLVPFILTNKLSRHVSDSNYWCPSDAGFVLEKSQHIGSCFPQSPITCLIFLFIRTCSFWLLPTFPSLSSAGCFTLYMTTSRSTLLEQDWEAYFWHSYRVPSFKHIALTCPNRQ